MGYHPLYQCYSQKLTVEDSDSKKTCHESPRQLVYASILRDHPSRLDEMFQ